MRWVSALPFFGVEFFLTLTLSFSLLCAGTSDLDFVSFVISLGSLGSRQ
jgi:hypothetical protein